MKKRVCVLTTGHEALDVRVFHKECKSLAEAGYEVYLIASHPEREVVEGVSIIPLNTRKDRAYRFLVKGWTVLWKALKLRADFYHFHDPDLIFAGLLLKLLGKTVIYDVHEDVPKDILSKEWLGSIRIRKIASILARSLFKLSALFFDGIIAATPSISENFPKHKTVTLRNVPKALFIRGIKPETLAKTRPSVIYAGGLTRIRGIKEIIEAIGKLEGLVELWLLGWWGRPEWKANL